MKTKVAYLHPKDIHRNLRDAHDGCVKHLIIESSSMDKVIERAARAAMRACHDLEPIGRNVKWTMLPASQQDMWRVIARAAYRAGGFVS